MKLEKDKCPYIYIYIYICLYINIYRQADRQIDRQIDIDKDIDIDIDKRCLFIESDSFLNHFRMKPAGPIK